MVGRMTTVQTRPTHRREMFRLNEIADIATLVPWTTIDVPIRPFRGAWSMNPSIHFDGELWRCVIRCADYAMPHGDTIRGAQASSGYVINRNAMLILDPDTLRTTKIFVMNEDDGQPRLSSCTAVGYEDMRLFKTGSGGLQGIAASLHLDRAPVPENRGPIMYRPRGGSLRRVPPREGAPRRQLGRAKVAHMAQPAPVRARWSPKNNSHGSHSPEQVLVSFDDEYNIVDALPLRGQWSGKPQKNWSPFDGADQPMFLYSIEDGKIFDTQGPLALDELITDKDPAAAPKPIKNQSSTEVRMMPRTQLQVNSGRGGSAGYRGLRGGTQLVYIGDRLDRAMGQEIPGGGWVSLAHDMRHVHGKKFYWHTLYLVDGAGELKGISEPFKLEIGHGIEFAAGLAVDGDRAVISYGVDDMICRLGVTSWTALLELIVPMDAIGDPTHEWYAREAHAMNNAMEMEGAEVIGDRNMVDGGDEGDQNDVVEDEPIEAPRTANGKTAPASSTAFLQTPDGSIPVEGVRR